MMLDLDTILVADENSGLVEGGRYYLFPSQEQMETYAELEYAEIDDEGVYCLRIFLDDLVNNLVFDSDIFTMTSIVFGLYDDAVEWNRLGHLSDDMFDLVRETLIGALA